MGEKREKFLGFLVFFIFEGLSVVFILSQIVPSIYYLRKNIIWGIFFAPGALATTLGGILALPPAIPFALNFIRRCRGKGVRVSSIIEAVKAFNIVFLSLALIILGSLMYPWGFGGEFAGDVLRSMARLCIAWFFVVIGVWEHKNNKRVYTSFTEDQVRFYLREKK